MEIVEKQLEENYVYKGRIINLRVDKALLPNGKTADREVVEHPGGATIAALTAENEILMVQQYRYPYFSPLTELPAGKLIPAEKPFETAVRELREECGATARNYYDLGLFYPTPGYCAEVIYLYAATDLTFTEQDLDEDEFLNVLKIPLERAVEMIISNELRDGKTQAAVLKLCELLKRDKLNQFKIEGLERHV